MVLRPLAPGRQLAQHHAAPHGAKEGSNGRADAAESTGVRGEAITGARVPERRAAACACSTRRSCLAGSRLSASGVTPSTTTRAVERSDPAATVASQSSPSAWNCRDCTSTAMPTSSNHTSGDVSCAPEGPVRTGLAMGSGRVGEVRMSASRSDSGTDHAPDAASSSRRLSLWEPGRPRASTQCSRSSSLTMRRCTASSTMPRAPCSSGALDAASITALGRHPSRKGPRSTTTSPASEVARMSTQATRRDRRGLGTSSRIGGDSGQDLRPYSAAAVVLANQESEPARSWAATSRCCCDGTPVCSA